MSDEINRMRATLGENLRLHGSRNWLHGVAGALRELADELEANQERAGVELIRAAASCVQCSAERMRSTQGEDRASCN